MADQDIGKYAIVGLLVVAGGLCFVAAGNLYSEPNQYTYQAGEVNEATIPPGIADIIETEAPSRVTESTETKTPHPTRLTSRVHQFRNLSPSAQQIFLKALNSSGVYRASTLPDDFELASDTGTRNYILYQNRTYELRVRNFGMRLVFNRLFVGMTVVVGTGLILGGIVLLWKDRKSAQK